MSRRFSFLTIIIPSTLNSNVWLSEKSEIVMFPRSIFELGLLKYHIFGIWESGSEDSQEEYYGLKI
ncbi:unnamed protein product [Brassica oleracea var. botrytis]